MKNNPYSWSKMSTYFQCPRKFKYTYIDKLPNRWEPSIHLDKGKLVHLIFELERDIPKIKEHKDFLEIKENNLLGPDGIKNCFKIYDDFLESTSGKKLMSYPRIFAELAIGLDENLEITTYENDDNVLRGFMDDARSIPDNDKVMITNDWKTGKYHPQETQKWGQLLYYSIGMFSRTPVDKILLNYVYVEHNKINSKIVYRKDIDKYKNALLSNINKIETDDTFDKCETALCDWCNFQETCLQD